MIATLTLLAASLTAEERLYRVSQTTYVAANILDSSSSLGRRELNPLYGHSFTSRDLAIKGGVTAGSLLLQEWMVRKWPRTRKVFTYVNFGWTGVYTAVGIRNFGQ